MADIIKNSFPLQNMGKAYFFPANDFLTWFCKKAVQIRWMVYDI